MTSPFHRMNRSLPDNNPSETCQAEGKGQFLKSSSPTTHSFNPRPHCPEKIILLSCGFSCSDTMQNTSSSPSKRCLERQRHSHHYSHICNSKNEHRYVSKKIFFSSSLTPLYIKETTAILRYCFCFPLQGSYCQFNFLSVLIFFF